MGVPELNTNYTSVGKTLMTVAQYKHLNAQTDALEQETANKKALQNAMASFGSGSSAASTGASAPAGAVADEGGASAGMNAASGAPIASSMNSGPSGTNATNQGAGTDYQGLANLHLKYGDTAGAAHIAQMGGAFAKNDPEARAKQIEAAQKELAYVQTVLPYTNLQNYSQFRADALKMMGANQHPALPDISTFTSHEDPQGDFEQWKKFAQYHAMTAKEQLDANTPKIQNMQVGDQEQPMAITPGQGVAGIQPVPGTGGPKAGLQDKYGQPVTSDTGELLMPNKKTGELTPTGQAGKPKEEPAVADSRRYRTIITDQNLGKPVTPEDAAWAKAYEKEKGISAVARAEAWGNIKQEHVFDTTDNTTKPISVAELNRAAAQEPGRYLTEKGGTTAINKHALINDMWSGAEHMETSLSNLKTPFTTAQKAELAMIDRTQDPYSAWSAFFGSKVAENLTHDQMDYLTDVRQIQERAMTMRTTLGAGQGSDELRDAIRKTVPSAVPPSPEFAKIQLDKFKDQIKILEQGIANPQLADKMYGAPGNAQKSGAAPAIDPEAAKAELRRRGLIK